MFFLPVIIAFIKTNTARADFRGVPEKKKPFIY